MLIFVTVSVVVFTISSIKLIDWLIENESTTRTKSGHAPTFGHRSFVTPVHEHPHQQVLDPSLCATSVAINHIYAVHAVRPKSNTDGYMIFVFCAITGTKYQQTTTKTCTLWKYKDSPDTMVPHPCWLAASWPPVISSQSDSSWVTSEKLDLSSLVSGATGTHVSLP